MSTTMGTSTSRKSNSAGSANPSASAAPGRRVPAARPSDRRDKAIAASDDRRDVSVAGLVICQGTTQRGNTDLEIALNDEGLGPDLRDQLRLADDLARAFDKSDQEIEGATADRDGLATFQQKSSCPEQPERTKGYFELGRVILAINCLDRRILRWWPAAMCADRVGIRNLWSSFQRSFGLRCASEIAACASSNRSAKKRIRSAIAPACQRIVQVGSDHLPRD